MILNLAALERCTVRVEWVVNDMWGHVKWWEGPFKLVEDGFVIQPDLVGYDGRWVAQFRTGTHFSKPVDLTITSPQHSLKYRGREPARAADGRRGS
jgi:hypothetical protein